MAGSFAMMCLPNCPSPAWYVYATPVCIGIAAVVYTLILRKVGHG